MIQLEIQTVQTSRNFARSQEGLELNVIAPARILNLRFYLRRKDYWRFMGIRWEQTTREWFGANFKILFHLKYENF
jgi:hypothetical protein